MSSRPNWTSWILQKNKEAQEEELKKGDRARSYDTLNKAVKPQPTRQESVAAAQELVRRGQLHPQRQVQWADDHWKRAMATWTQKKTKEDVQANIARRQGAEIKAQREVEENARRTPLKSVEYKLPFQHGSAIKLLRAVTDNEGNTHGYEVEETTPAGEVIAHSNIPMSHMNSRMSRGHMSFGTDRASPYHDHFTTATVEHDSSGIHLHPSGDPVRRQAKTLPSSQ